jgi:hypothetical protein
MSAELQAVPERTVWLTYPGPGIGEAKARIVERSAQWRRSGALKQLAMWLLLPVVAIIPPHIPWVLIVLALGAFRAWSRWNEHATLLSLHGPCPKCGFDQEYAELGPLKPRHKVNCRNCRWDLHLLVSPPRGLATSDAAGRRA